MGNELKSADIMDLQKLKKEDFPSAHDYNREPCISFYANGKIVLNKFAVRQLKLFDNKVWGSVAFYHNPKDPSEISISGDINGFKVRENTDEGCVFNNKNLAVYVIDVIWSKCVRPVGDASEKPNSYSFRIARVPVDDDHKNVFALIRKKK
jgi:hypothetical protein